MKKMPFFVIAALLMIQLSSSALAEEMDDPALFGLEIEKLLNLGSGMLAAALFIVTLIACKRTGQKRLQYVSAAFALFAIKGFLTAHELFVEEWSWVDPTASALNFAILLAFFIGMLKK